MRKIRNHFQVCRWTKCDLWGRILLSKRQLFRLFNAIYYRRRAFTKKRNNFLIRFDHKSRKRKNLSRYAMTLMEKRKISQFYMMSQKQLKNLILRFRGTQGAFQNFISNLELRPFMLLWRAGFYRTPMAARDAILRGFVSVNFKEVCSPNRVLSVLDFLTIKNKKTMVNIRALIRRRRFFLREHHFITNFALASIFICKLRRY